MIHIVKKDRHKRRMRVPTLGDVKPGQFFEFLDRTLGPRGIMVCLYHDITRSYPEYNVKYFFCSLSNPNLCWSGSENSQLLRERVYIIPRGTVIKITVGG